MLRTTRDVGYSYQPHAETQYRFRFWHVETLLNHASELLDRCLKEKAEGDALMAAGMRLELDTNLKHTEVTLRRERYKEGAFSIAQRSNEFDRNALPGIIEAAHNSSVQHERAASSANNAGNQSAGYSGSGAQWGALASEREAQLRLDKARYTEPMVTTEVTWQRLELESQEALVQTTRDSIITDETAFAFFQQANRAYDRAENSFGHAYDRLHVAARGLREIYGYNDNPLPPTSERNRTLINVTVWTRNAIQWLAAFGQLDQAFNNVVSLRHAADLEWVVDRNVGVIHGSFRLADTLLDTFSHVRVRGLSCLIAATDRVVGPWSALVRLPRSARTRHGVPPQKANWVDNPLDQSDVPPCLLGRVEHVNAFRAPDICGMISLFNASPIGVAGDDGKWTFSVTSQAGGRSQVENVQDVLLEVNLVGRLAA